MAKLLEKIILQVQGSVSPSSPVPGSQSQCCLCAGPGQYRPLRPLGPCQSWGADIHRCGGRRGSSILPGVSFHLDRSHCHYDTARAPFIVMREAIMSGLCNVCDYLSNCHCGIVCQFLLFNREKRETGKQRARSGNSNVYLAEISQCEEQDKTPAQWKSHSNRVTWMLHLGLGDVAIKARSCFSPLICPAQARPKSVRIRLSPVFVWLTGAVGGGGWLHKWEHFNWSPP